jgi:hypothetical protein
LSQITEEAQPQKAADEEMEVDEFENSQTSNEDGPAEQDGPIGANYAVVTVPIANSLTPEREFQYLQNLLNGVAASLAEAAPLMPPKRLNMGSPSPTLEVKAPQVGSSVLWGPMDPENIQPLMGALQTYLSSDTSIAQPHKIYRFDGRKFLHLHFLEQRASMWVQETCERPHPQKHKSHATCHKRGHFARSQWRLG